MPVALLIIGAIFAVAALRNTHRELGTQLASDFTGGGNFVYWVAAIVVIGALGYIPHFQTPSRALLALVLLVFVLSNQGVFAQFQSALNAPQAATAAVEPKAPGPLTVNVNLGGGGGSGSSAASAIGGAGSLAKSIGGLFSL